MRHAPAAAFAGNAPVARWHALTTCFWNSGCHMGLVISTSVLVRFHIICSSKSDHSMESLECFADLNTFPCSLSYIFCISSYLSWKVTCQLTTLQPLVTVWQAVILQRMLFLFCLSSQQCYLESEVIITAVLYNLPSSSHLLRRTVLSRKHILPIRLSMHFEQNSVIKSATAGTPQMAFFASVAS